MNSTQSSLSKRKVNTPVGSVIPSRASRGASQALSLRAACAAAIEGLPGWGGNCGKSLPLLAFAALLSPIASQTVSAQTATPGLLGQYFSITPANINNVDPDFASFTSLQAHLGSAFPSLVATATSLNFQTNGSGFPAPYNSGATNLESYYSGLINIGTAGRYTFNTSSDDGTILFIDGQTVVNNNFFQGVTTRTGAITLSAGYHYISAGFYQGTGGYGMNAQISGPGDVIMVDLDINNPNATLTADVIMRTLSGSSPLVLASGNVITGQDNTSDTFGGVISGIGGITKWGTGTLTLTGNNTNTGPNVVGVGTLVGTTASLKGDIINSGTLVFDQTVSTPALASGTYAGVLSGAGSVTKINAGTVTFTGANTYTGPTNVNGGTLASNTAGLGATSRVTLNNGTLQATTGGITLAGPVTVTGAGTFDTNGNDSKVLGAVGGTGSLVKTGAGILTLSDISTYTGATNITGGTLKLNPLQPGLNEGHLINNAFDVTSPIPLTSVTLGTTRSESNDTGAFMDNSTWGYTGYIINPSSTNATWTFAENFDDNVLLKIDGVTVLNDTTWNSPTKANYTLTPGRHLIEARFGQGGGGVGPTNAQWLTGGIGFGYDSQGRNDTVASNYVALIDPGDGSLFNLGYGSLPSSTAVAMSSNTTLDVTGAVQTVGSLADAAGSPTGHSIIINSAALTIGNDNTSTAFSGAITGAGTLTKIGTGTQSLNGASTYTGVTTLNAGGLNLNNASAIGTGPLVINGGSLGNTSPADITLSTNNAQTWAGNFTYTGTKNLNLGTGAVTLTGNRQVAVNSNTLTVGGVISGTGTSLTKAGPGILILTSPTAYTGNTIIQGGTLKPVNATNPNILASSPVLTVGTGATLDVTGLSGGGITLTGTETLNGNGTVQGSVTTVSGSNVSPGIGNIGVLTVGNLTLVSGAKLSYWLGGSTFGGVIAVNGNLVLPSSGLNLLLFDDANASGKGSIPAAGTYTLFTYTGTATGFNPATTFATQPGRTYTFTNAANKITMTLAIQSLTWTGQTGGTGIANSVWSPVPTNWANGTTATSYSDGNIVVFQDTNTANGNAPITNGAVTINANVAPTSVTFNNSVVPYTFSGTAGITGGTSITKTGTALVRLQNANTFTGPVTINAGAINISNSAALGTSTGVTVAAGAALQLEGGIFAPAIPLTLNGTGLAGATAGALNNVRDSNIYNGAITLGSASTIGNTAGSLELTGGVVNGGFNLTVSGAGNTTFSTGSITGAGGLIKTGAGTLTLSAANSYTGGTIISGGTVEGTSNSLKGDIINNASLVFNQALASPAISSGTYAGVISGTGKVTKNNAGELILTSANTYTGGTTVNGGTLALAVGGNIGTLAAGSTVTVNNGAVLRLDAADALGYGTGSVAPVTLNGGTMSIAASIHATLPAITMTAGTLTSVGAAVGDGTGNYILDGSITTLASADPSVISAPKINLRGGAVTGSPVEFNIARGTGLVDLRVASTITDNGNGLLKTGAGILVLAKDNSYTGATTINAGTVVAGARGLSSGPVTVAAGATLSVSQTGNVGLAGQYFNLTPANTANSNPNFTALDSLRSSLASTTPSLVANATTLNFENNGKGFPAPYNLSAENFQTYHSGMLNIPVEGSYTFNTSSDDGSVIYIDGNLVVDNNFFQGVTTRTGNVTLAAGYHNIAVAFYQGGGGYGLNAQISGPGDAIMADIGSASASAPITPDLVVSSLSGAGNVSLATGSLITGQDNSSTTFSGVISGIGGVNKWGTGTQTLSGASTYTGGTSVVKGTVKLGNASALGSGPISVSQGAALDINGFNQSIAAISGKGSIALGSGTLTMGADNSSTSFDGTISGSGGLTKAGSGTLLVTGTNFYTGPTAITGGTLKLPDATAPSQAGLYEGRIATNFDLVTPLPKDSVKLSTEKANSTDAGAFIDNSTWGYTGKILNNTTTPQNVTFGEHFDDSVLLVIDGVQVLNNTVWNTQTTGNYTLSPGYHSIELRLGQGGGGVGPTNGGLGGSGLGVAYSFDNGSTWMPFTDPGDGSLLTTGTDVSSGVPSTSSVVMSSGTAFDLSGNTIRVGSVADASTTTTGHQVLLGGGTLIAGSDNTNTTFSGSVTGPGNITKVGTGTWTLKGANTYGGATNVNGGVLMVSGSINGTTAVNVASFATLGGSGSITTANNGNVVLADGAKLAPGLVGGAGKLTLTLGIGNLSLAAAVNTANSQSLLFDLGSVAVSDQIVLATGVLDIGSGVLGIDDFVFTNSGGFAVGTYKLFDGNSPILGTMAANLSGNVNGLLGTLSLADSGRDIILTVAVPEPGSFALLGGAGLMLGLKRFRRSLRRS